MATNIPNRSPFLREQRMFPQEAQPLSIEIDRAYTDIANSVNSRSLGLYTSNQPIQNGDRWYQNGLLYQGFRQFFTFTALGSIPHNINVGNIFAFTPNCYGSLTDGTNWYGVIFQGSLPTTGQVSFYITPTNIVISAGAGAPAITSGFIVLDWLSNS